MTIEVRCGMGWMPDGRPGDLRPATVEEYVAEIGMLRAEIAQLRSQVGDNIELQEAEQRGFERGVASERAVQQGAAEQK